MMTMRKHSLRGLRGLASLVLVFVAMPVNSASTDYTEVPLSELVRLDIYAPSVLRSHLHEKGEWMLGYELMTMSMEGSREGTESVSDQDVLQQFMVTPTHMSMDMHMFHLMYAPSNDLTLIMMLAYLDKSMLHLTQAGGTFQTQSSGLGDVKISVNQVLSEVETTNGVHRFALTYGISLPTGSIDEEYFLPPIGANARLPYPMQLGSGTFDPSIGALYLGYTSKYYWGTQIVATMRMGHAAPRGLVSAVYQAALLSEASGFTARSDLHVRSASWPKPTSALPPRKVYATRVRFASPKGCSRMWISTPSRFTVRTRAVYVLASTSASARS